MYSWILKVSDKATEQIYLRELLEDTSKAILILKYTWKMYLTFSQSFQFKASFFISFGVRSF